MSTSCTGAVARAAVTGSKVLATGRWLRISEINYTDPKGASKTWEVAERTTTSEETDSTREGADGCCIVPCLRKRGAPFIDGELILVSQFRPPTGRYTLEFPAGLIDAGEDAMTAGLRELTEETGYVGEDEGMLPTSCLDPGMSRATIKMAKVLVDSERSENLEGMQKQGEEDKGLVRVHRVPVRGMLQALNELAEREDLLVHTGLLMFAGGIAMAME
jgi:8-oxo-dGTP pyrophosphatase MutT (NUDIX family)